MTLSVHVPLSHVSMLTSMLVSWTIIPAAIAQLSNEAENPRAAKLVATIEAERLKLFSGVMHGAGNDSYEDKNAKVSFGGSSEFVLKFDQRLDAVLIDRTSPENPLIHDGISRSPNEGKEGRYVLAELRDEKYFFDSRRNGLGLDIDELQKVGTRDSREKGYLDPRKLGMSCGDHMFDSKTLELACSLFTKAVGEPVVPDSHGLMKVVKQSNYRVETIWIDTKHGHTIIRKLVEWGTKSDDQSKFNTAAVLIDESVKWELAQGVYVPVFYESREIMPYPREGLEITSFDVNNYHFRTLNRRYDFEWSQVNEPLDPSTFDYHNFELPAGTAVADLRTPSVDANGDIRFTVVEYLGDRTTKIPKQKLDR